MYRIAVDIGGTFTDIVLTDSRNTFSEKVYENVSKTYGTFAQ